MARPKPSTRIGEAERTSAQRALQQHQAAGRLPITEYAERSAAAGEAVFASEITALFADLPRPHPQLPGSSGGMRRNLTIAAVVAVVVLVGVLAVTAGRPGPTPPPVAAPTPTAAPVVPVLPTSEPVPTSTVSADPSTDPTADPSAGGTVGPPPGGVTVRRTTGGQPITLRQSYGVDLDDDTSPNWGVAAGCCNLDVTWGSEGSNIYLETDYAVMTGPADYTACSEETAYTSGPLERGTLTPDENICLRTNGHRYAIVTIISASDQAVQFRATVWDPPFA